MQFRYLNPRIGIPEGCRSLSGIRKRSTHEQNMEKKKEDRLTIKKKIYSLSKKEKKKENWQLISWNTDGELCQQIPQIGDLETGRNPKRDRVRTRLLGRTGEKLAELSSMIHSRQALDCFMGSFWAN